MKIQTTIIIAVIGLFCLGFAGAFILQSQNELQDEISEPTLLSRWFDLDPEQEAAINDYDPGFPEDLRKHRETLSTERDKLIQCFKNSEISDEELQKQFEEVIAAHNKLERRVGKNLLLIRSHLNADQQKKLFDLCAENIDSHQKQYRWRHGWQSRKDEASDDKNSQERGNQRRHGQRRQGKNR